jgi:hypothetical protein
VFRNLTAVVLFLFFAMGASAQTGAAIVKGQVTDDSGAVIPGAKVSALGPGGAVRAVTSGADGSYSLAGLTPGSWTIVGAAPGLKQINPAKVEVGPSGAQTVNLSLSVVLEDQQVTVKENSAPALSTSADANVGAIVLRSEDLDALSDDPDEMQNDLQALAGPSAGPDGGQIYIDGFTGGTLPPKSSIREIRINQNPVLFGIRQAGVWQDRDLHQTGHGQVARLGLFQRERLAV